MTKVDVPVRGPTTTAWAATLIAWVALGEVAYEVNRPEMAHIFGIPFADDELWLALGGLALVALLAVGWLVSLYLAPGRLHIDPEGDRVVRVRRLAWRVQATEGPMSSWSVTLRYFSRRDQDRHRFKTLHLSGPGTDEVILSTDLKSPQIMVQTLEALGERLGQFKVELDRP